MTSFITQSLREVLSRKHSISDYTFILPSKRAGSFLIHELATLSSGAMFAPRVLSIEDFAEEMSGLKAIDNTSAIFEFYSAYLACTPKEQVENFETFSSWAQTLLYDFNEIDRYLIDYKPFFDYLSNIQEINHWYLQEEKTPLMENYLSFWRKLPEYYEQLKRELEHKNMAYQGMVYRVASEKVEEYMRQHRNPHVFIGFNALNEAEQRILQKMLERANTEVFWDIDEVFFKDTQHDASLFLREYARTWPYYRENAFPVENVFGGEKKIEMVGVPKNIGQAKYVGEILAGMEPEEIRQTAVVLGDEGMLLPILNSLPPNVQEVNVTMGFPLKNAPVSFLFDQLFKMQSQNRQDLYYKDLFEITNHPLIQKLTKGYSLIISERIQEENLVYLSVPDFLKTLPEHHRPLFETLLQGWEGKPLTGLKSLQKLLFLFREKLDRDKDKLTLEFLYQYHLLFNKLSDLLQEYTHITSVKSLYSIFKELVSTQSVDFRGKPFSGLQIMGMLESRVLDFKNVILTSVNEGVLPAGKSSNSFIPYDLKCSYKLPTYKEKDAVYTYHFYHLMQRAENLFLLYNTESDGLNAGEKSRFLLQLEMEKLPNHHIRKYTVAPKVPSIEKTLQCIPKSEEILQRIRARAEKGFSPSALTTYIRNPLDFYHQYVLGIREAEEVEETIAYNTLGTVVHQALETFYKQWLGKEISIEDLQAAIKKAPEEVALQFEKEYSKEPLTRGKNLLIFEVAKRYVLNFLKMEIKELKEGNVIKVVQVESNLRSRVSIPELNFPVYIHGNVDRVDTYNGGLRIIDYKTGKVQQAQVEIADWDRLSSDYDKYGKTFQILTYASMLNDQSPFENAEAGIISFKNLQSGFLKFSQKNKEGRGAVKNSRIDQEVLNAFQEQLKELIIEICNPEIPFQEKEIVQKSW